MKQIGARQEAGRIGGIGPCGRELCCATWMTSFVSVSTSAARFQDISLNPQKLAGQCAKLKCCLNYEVDWLRGAQKRLPSREITLETKDGEFFFFKADILSNQITYSSDKNIPRQPGDHQRQTRLRDYRFEQTWHQARQPDRRNPSFRTQKAGGLAGTRESHSL